MLTVWSPKFSNGTCPVLPLALNNMHVLPELCRSISSIYCQLRVFVTIWNQHHHEESITVYISRWFRQSIMLRLALVRLMDITDMMKNAQLFHLYRERYSHREINTEREDLHKYTQWTSKNAYRKPGNFWHREFQCYTSKYLCLILIIYIVNASNEHILTINCPHLQYTMWNSHKRIHWDWWKCPDLSVCIC